ncbi:hypothetical protein Tco_0738758 [Tanacetum coccineum]
MRKVNELRTVREKQQVEFFDFWKLVSPLGSVMEGLMSNVQNEGSIYKFRICYGIIDELGLRRNHADVGFHNPGLINEATVVVAFIDALIMEERFLKQKAKIDWLREGDSNSAYFHKVVKSRISRSRIDVVTCADGTTVDNEKVADAFVSHYEQFLGLPGITSPFS